MYYFNTPYQAVPFFNLNRINYLAGLNPLESNRLLGDFFTYLTKKRINKSQIYRTITERLQNA